jgi:hypothetical protein
VARNCRWSNAASHVFPRPVASALELLLDWQPSAPCTAGRMRASRTPGRTGSG